MRCRQLAVPTPSPIDPVAIIPAQEKSSQVTSFKFERALRCFKLFCAHAAVAVDVLALSVTNAIPHVPLVGFRQMCDPETTPEKGSAVMEARVLALALHHSQLVVHALPSAGGLVLLPLALVAVPVCHGERPLPVLLVSFPVARVSAQAHAMIGARPPHTAPLRAEGGHTFGCWTRLQMCRPRRCRRASSRRCTCYRSPSGTLPSRDAAHGRSGRCTRLQTARRSTSLAP